jgi:phospholipid-binding lipoprotein MlaA
VVCVALALAPLQSQAQDNDSPTTTTRAKAAAKPGKPQKKKGPKARPEAGKAEKAKQQAAARTEELLKEYEAEGGKEAKAIADPLKYWNLMWFHFNDKLYFWFLKPVSRGYGFLVPRVARIGIKNVYVNLGFPIRFVNTSLQGKFKGAGAEFGRFVVNSTVGVLGLWDPATQLFHWKTREEDFDQTLGVWKIGMGVFLTWPVLGPSSIRGTFGYAADAALNPATFLPGAGTLRQINDTSLDLNPYESIRDMAVSPYTAVRDAYVQNRKKEISE